MSWNGSPEPNRLPWIRFSNRVSSAPGSSIVFLVGSARPVTTTVPPLRIALNAFVTTSEVTMPTVTIALSAPTPRVSSVISSCACPAVSQLCVAPSCSAISRLLASGSIATTFLAPASAAPWTALMPIPPIP